MDSTWIKRLIFSSLLFLTVLIFSVSVFKNISYPLLWNDEADTMIFGRRVLEKGYPKVHDGKNVLDLTTHPDRGLGIKEEYDAFITIPWSQYYFAALIELFAPKDQDFYQKTASSRIPFALVGMLGLWIMGRAASRLLEDKNKRKIFLISFFGLSALSISLTLHLREARYYSLVIFFGGLAFWIFSRWYFENKSNFLAYFFLAPFSLFCLFNTFFPSYFIFTASFILYPTFDFFLKLRKKQIIFTNPLDLTKKITSLPEFHFFLRTTLPIITSLLFAIPLISFFEVFHVGNEVAKNQHLDYLANIFQIGHFFGQWEFLYFAMITEIATILLYFSKRCSLNAQTAKIFRLSNFLILFFLIHTLVISRVPFLFERYFIILIPVLNLLIVANIFIIFEALALSKGKIPTKKIICVLALIFILNSSSHEKDFRGHWKELNNRYQGPLDFAIPYLAKKYPNPENLIIATNYEEPAFMYYLGAKVIVGYVGNNLDEDSKITPDVIIPRKNRDNNLETLDNFRKKNTYEKISFDVYDSQTNNIPELDCPLYHLYETKPVSSENEKLEIFIRK